MFRRIAPILLALPLVIACAGPTKLAQKSEEKLAGGDAWKAWQLATRALDKEPGNPRARHAAAASGAMIVQDWRQRIHALASVDTLKAAEQILELARFRAGAVRYAALPAGDEASVREEEVLRLAAARIHYRQGLTAREARRPKAAYLEFSGAERFVTGYRDAARLAEQAWTRAVTRVAVMPLRAFGDPSLGRDAADAWRDALSRSLVEPEATFTRFLGADAVERSMSVSQLGNLSRDEALRIGRKAGAQRVVWGTMGTPRAQTRLHLFHDTICRRIATRDAEGNSSTRWVDVPIEVVARTREVSVPVEYEVIATADGATLAHQRFERSTMARVVWTSYVPEGSLDAYTLVSDAVRAEHPDRARDVETRWKTTCGEATTLQQVLQARRSTTTSNRYERGTLARFMAGAAFVFLEELPPTEDLALVAASQGWEPVRQDLARLDAVDDVDLGVALSEPGR